MGANDHLAEFFRGKTLAAGFCGTLFHGWLQSNAFNRADFRKAGPAKDEARLAAFSGRALLLWHVRKSTTYFPVCHAVSGECSPRPLANGEPPDRASPRRQRARPRSSRSQISLQLLRHGFCGSFVESSGAALDPRRFDAGDLRGAPDGWRGQTGARSTIVTSHDHVTLSALVIIVTQISPRFG